MKRMLFIFLLFVTLVIIDTTIYAYNEYKVGDVIPYNNVDYYVIKNSGADDSTVSLLKKEPLTVAEVNLYGGVGTDNNHVNMYNCVGNQECNQTAYNVNGYGGMAYYSSETCDGDILDDCTNNYDQSEVKYVLESWANANVPKGLVEIRLLDDDDFEHLGYVKGNINPSTVGWIKTDDTPSWVYSENYYYWIKIMNDDYLWTLAINIDGSIASFSDFDNTLVVRPVIILSKTAIEDSDESSVNIDDSKTPASNETKDNVKVKNTAMTDSIIMLVIGVLCLFISIVTYFVMKGNRKDYEKRT